MATHKSALKRARQTARRNARNRALRSALRTVMKRFRARLEEKDLATAQKELPSVHRAIDKAVTKGILHRNTAARNKSRMALALRKAGAA
jgi:small subunit ribosomal protein S20